MSLSISQHIYAVLSASDELRSYVGDKIFPISSAQTTTFPFVLYKRMGFELESNKDYEEDTVQVCVSVASNEYKESVAIAEIIRQTLDNKTAEYGTFEVDDATLVDADEDFIEDTYIQKLFFNFNTYKNE